jgi:hypothetical protein
MKSIIFWDVTPCSPSSINRRVGGTYHFHFQGRRNKFSKNQPGSRWQAELIFSTLKMEAICSPKRRLKLDGLNGVISQKMILFITTAVKTPNPTH